jgi:membrane protein implicated in regulation of membrane protease activity
MEQMFTELTVWHWLAIGLVVFGVEMMTGTFDLLMVAVAAWLTAAFAYIAPDAITAWQHQLVFFGIASVVTIILGRTVFAGMRKTVDEHPTLNKRMVALIGRRGAATEDFEAGIGQIKIGDTVWGAEVAAGEIIKAGDAIVVESARMTTAIVRKA